MAMECYAVFSMEEDQMDLPAGFRFHPTDEELITHYLCKKVLNNNFTAVAIGEADLNKIEPWDLPKQAKMGEKEWYFFVVKDRKYPTGSRANRATEAGYWKATGKDKEIYSEKEPVGMKKTLVFYKGRAPKGVKTNWVMHEYRLDGELAKKYKSNNEKNEWVISRVFEKGSGSNPPDGPEDVVNQEELHPTPMTGVTNQEELHPASLPPLMDTTPYESESKFLNNNAGPSNVVRFSNPLVVENAPPPPPPSPPPTMIQQPDLSSYAWRCSNRGSFSDMLLDPVSFDYQLCDTIPMLQDHETTLNNLIEATTASFNEMSQGSYLRGEGEGDEMINNYLSCAAVSYQDMPQCFSEPIDPADY